MYWNSSVDEEVLPDDPLVDAAVEPADVVAPDSAVVATVERVVDDTVAIPVVALVVTTPTVADVVMPEVAVVAGEVEFVAETARNCTCPKSTFPASGVALPRNWVVEVPEM